jgi:polyhydroxyalkanoate synthesis repressor PhaR
MLVKKYGNRRLYDTDESRYITLEELADAVRRGAEPRVVDAKTNEDLTQATLAQILVEGRGAGRLLPLPLLIQLVRLGDDALAEFFGRYVSWALEVYVQVKQGAVALTSLSPFGGLSGLSGLGRLISPFGGGFAGPAQPMPPVPTPATQQTPTPSAPVPPAAAPVADDLAALRRELEALKKEVGASAAASSQGRVKRRR